LVPGHYRHVHKGVLGREMENMIPRFNVQQSIRTANAM